MEICNSAKKFPYLKVRNFFNPEELRLVWQELDFLTHFDKMNPPSQTGQKDPHMKNNVGVFLEQVYVDRKYSNILRLNRKLFSDVIISSYESLHYTHRYLGACNSDSTLVSYYENSGYYKSHMDLSVVTSIIWLYKEPKRFEGGDLIFTNFEETVNVENNMMIMFPSCVHHEVTSIEMPIDVVPYTGYGRYALTNFVTHAI
jgi:Rps23 Pro-64 3,4-dihydroxylase Tpa1-like proline 4-hydroxylase